jgi:hypothetical protein
VHLLRNESKTMTMAASQTLSALPAYPAAEFRKHLSEIAVLAGYRNRPSGLLHHRRLLAVLVSPTLYLLNEELLRRAGDVAAQNEIIVQIAQLMRVTDD